MTHLVHSESNINASSKPVTPADEIQDSVEDGHSKIQINEQANSELELNNNEVLTFRGSGSSDVPYVNSDANVQSAVLMNSGLITPSVITQTNQNGNNPIGSNGQVSGVMTHRVVALSGLDNQSQYFIGSARHPPQNLAVNDEESSVAFMPSNEIASQRLVNIQPNSYNSAALSVNNHHNQPSPYNQNSHGTSFQQATSDSDEVKKAANFHDRAY